MKRSFFTVIAMVHAVAFAGVPKLISGVDIVRGAPVSVSLLDPGRIGTVVIFLSAQCPCSMGHETHLAELAKKYPNFSFVGIHSNVDEPMNLVEMHFKNMNPPFPVLQDEGQVFANAFGALKTPHVFIVDKLGKIQFEGGVDDSRLSLNSDRHYLENALTELSAGKTSPTVTSAKTLGCFIKRIKTDSR